MNINKLSLITSLVLGILGVTLVTVEPVSSQENQTEQPRPTKRLRATFFEEERRLKFGEGLFLQSALDGEQNTFADPAKISRYNSDLIRNVEPIDGTITVLSRDPDESDFLVSDFVSSSSSSGSASVNLSIITRNSDDRTGTMLVKGTIDGQSYNFVGDYIAGYSGEGDTFAGVVLVTDPNNPSNSILIEVPPTDIDGFADYDDSDPVKSRASLSVGLPTDR